MIFKREAREAEFQKFKSSICFLFHEKNPDNSDKKQNRKTLHDYLQILM